MIFQYYFIHTLIFLLFTVEMYIKFKYSSIIIISIIIKSDLDIDDLDFRRNSPHFHQDEIFKQK